MRKNIVAILVTVMFLAVGVVSAFAEGVEAVEKSAVKAIEKTVICAADSTVCKEKSVGTDCKKDGKDCKDTKDCKDGKTGCDMKKAEIEIKKEEVKPADCGNAQGCGAQMKIGCGMKKK